MDAAIEVARRVRGGAAEVMDNYAATATGFDGSKAAGSGCGCR